ncbi:glucosidase II beta subunit-like-domain-containing protein [Hyaloraphidium curvatum]|nr:glucosidase II beta subunit-like-domain-containing protein [Hyaloraphidium curvatum]
MAGAGLLRASAVLLVLGAALALAAASESAPPRPKDPKLRGVPHSQRGAYEPLPPTAALLAALAPHIRTSAAFDKEEPLWRCADGAVVPWAWVNDDYCDCADGSDEPGTSACAHIKGAKFHCRNPRHVPANIEAKLVDDGICDPECCDGSSEVAPPHMPPPCPNTCRALAAAAAEAKAAAAKIRKAGLEKRKEWEEGFAKQKAEKEARLSELRGMVEEERRKVEILRGEKDVAEAIRASTRAAASPTPAPAPPAPEPAAAAPETGTDGGDGAEFTLGEPYVETVDEPASEPAAEAAGEGKKDEQFFPYPKEYAPPPAGEAPPSAPPPAGEAPPSAESGEKKEGDEQFFPYPKEYAPPPAGGEAAPAKDEDLDYNDYPDPEEDYSAPPPPPPPQQEEYEEELPETRAYEDAAAKLRELENEQREIEGWTGKDFGPGGVWAGVGENGCFEGVAGEYKYEFCVHGQATQKSAGTNMRIAGLGSFTGFSDGFSTLKWEHGDTCWNGPARSATVRVECGAENVVEGVTEPSKCEYHVRMKSPAACTAE